MPDEVLTPDSPQAPQAEEVATSAATSSAEVAVDASASASPPAPAPAPKEDWRDKRIAKLTARNHELAGKLQAQPHIQQPQVNAEFDRLVKEEAERRAGTLVTQRLFDAECAKTADEGNKLYPDFNDSIKALVAQVDMSDPVEQTLYNNFLSVAMETGEGAKVLYELGKDPEEAGRVMRLSPAKMGIALAKMVLVAPIEAASNVPKPPISVGRSGKGTETGSARADDPKTADTLTTAEWMEQRKAQEKRRR